jgi:shikimate kinase
MRIYLIGFMGCGKSTMGKKLAEKLDYPFIDIDKRIEAIEGGSVAEVFKLRGEDYFRKLESDVLHSTVLEKNAVISCGGGTPCYFDNMEWMNARGKTVYLFLPPEKLFGRLRTRKEKRPLIANFDDEQLKDYIFQKLSERETFYLQAAFKIDPSVAKPKDVVALLKGK